MPTQSAAPVIRSGFSPWKTCANPAPTSPTTISGPTRTSSRKRVNCRSGSIASTGSGWATRPSASVGTRNSDICALPLTSSVPVRATTMSACASSTPEM